MKNEKAKSTRKFSGGKDRLIVSLSINERKGFELVKKLTPAFAELKFKYNIKKFGRSVLYYFDNFYIKVSNFKFDKGIVEFTIFEQTSQLKEVVEKVVEIMKEYYVDSEKNQIFITSHGNFYLPKDKTSIVQVNKDAEERYSFKSEGNIFSISTWNTYEAKLDESLNDEMKFEETLKTIINIKKGTLSFLPYAIMCSVSNVDKVKEKFRDEVKSNFEM